MNESQSFQCDPKAIEAWCAKQEQALAAVIDGRASMVPIRNFERMEHPDLPGVWITISDGIVSIDTPMICKDETHLSIITHDISQHE